MKLPASLCVLLLALPHAAFLARAKPGINVLGHIPRRAALGAQVTTDGKVQDGGIGGRAALPHLPAGVHGDGVAALDRALSRQGTQQQQQGLVKEQQAPEQHRKQEETQRQQLQTQEQQQQTQIQQQEQAAPSRHTQQEQGTQQRPLPQQQYSRHEQARQRLQEREQQGTDVNQTGAAAGEVAEHGEGPDGTADTSKGGADDGSSDGGDYDGVDSGGGHGDGGHETAAGGEPALALPPPPDSPHLPPRPPPLPPRPPPKPPLPLAVMPDPQSPAPERCVFVLGTGRSGSTSLVDALNQMPHYLIRGEQGGSFWFLYLAWKALYQAAQHSTDFRAHERQAEERFGERGAARLTFDTVKLVYETYAVQKKMPWFSDMHRSRLADAARAFYAETYGYHGPGIVSGFKEIRFVCGRAFPSHDCRYQDFDNFIRFLRLLCTEVKIVLNSRASASAEDNAKLTTMLYRDGVLNDTDRFVTDLAVTHEWYDRYAEAHPAVAFRVIMEDMFDPKVNASLARRLLQFLHEDDAHHIAFNRMPTWSSQAGLGRSKHKKKHSDSKLKDKGGRREPWQLRRRRRLREGSSSDGSGSRGSLVEALEALLAGAGVTEEVARLKEMLRAAAAEAARAEEDAN